MNFFFCCMKRDKPVVSNNKPSKEALYNFVINDKIAIYGKSKKEEDSSEGKTTNAEEISNISQEPFLSSPKKEKRFVLNTNLDSDAEDHYEYLLFERSSNEGWDLETNKEDLMIWTKLDSKYQSKCPFIKTCFKIKLEPLDNITPENIFEALYQPEKRKEWDNSVLMFENYDYDESKTSCKSYMATKVPIVSNRDFLERRLIFKDLKAKEDVSIFWQIEDEKYPKTVNFTRAYTRIGGTLIKAQGDELELWSLSQVDADLKTFVNALRKMLSGNLEKWVINLRSYLKRKYRKEGDEIVNLEK